MISKAKSKRFLACCLLTLVAAIASAQAEYDGGTNTALRGGAYPSAEDLFPMTTRRLTTLDTPKCYPEVEFNCTGAPPGENPQDLSFGNPPELSLAVNCPLDPSQCTANDATPLGAR